MQGQRVNHKFPFKVWYRAHNSFLNTDVAPHLKQAIDSFYDKIFSDIFLTAVICRLSTKVVTASSHDELATTKTSWSLTFPGLPVRLAIVADEHLLVSRCGIVLQRHTTAHRAPQNYRCPTISRNRETFHTPTLMSYMTTRIPDEGGWRGVGGTHGAASVQQLGGSFTRTDRMKLPNSRPRYDTRCYSNVRSRVSLIHRTEPKTESGKQEN